MRQQVKRRPKSEKWKDTLEFFHKEDGPAQIYQQHIEPKPKLPKCMSAFRVQWSLGINQSCVCTRFYRKLSDLLLTQWVSVLKLNFVLAKTCEYFIFLCIENTDDSQWTSTAIEGSRKHGVFIIVHRWNLEGNKSWPDGNWHTPHLLLLLPCLYMSMMFSTSRLRCRPYTPWRSRTTSWRQDGQRKRPPEDTVELLLVDR